VNKFLSFALLRSTVRTPVATKPAPAPIPLSEKQLVQVSGGLPYKY